MHHKFSQKCRPKQDLGAPQKLKYLCIWRYLNWQMQTNIFSNENSEWLHNHLAGLSDRPFLSRFSLRRAFLSLKIFAACLPRMLRTNQFLFPSYSNKKLKLHVSLTNRATHLCKRNGMVDLKRFPSHIMYYHAEFGRSALNDVGINTGEPPKLGSAGTPLSWDGRRGWPPKYTPSPTCVTTSNLIVLQLSVSAWHSVDIGQETLATDKLDATMPLSLQCQHCTCITEMTVKNCTVVTLPPWLIAQWSSISVANPNRYRTTGLW